MTARKAFPTVYVQAFINPHQTEFASAFNTKKHNQPLDTILYKWRLVSQSHRTVLATNMHDTDLEGREN
jgi:hypothetical protein